MALTESGPFDDFAELALPESRIVCIGQADQSSNRLNKNQLDQSLYCRFPPNRFQPVRNVLRSLSANLADLQVLYVRGLDSQPSSSLSWGLSYRHPNQLRLGWPSGYMRTGNRERAGIWHHSLNNQTPLNSHGGPVCCQRWGDGSYRRYRLRSDCLKGGSSRLTFTRMTS